MGNSGDDTQLDVHFERHFDKDTQLCLSISARPSNFGTRFHNFLYRELRLNFVYRACAVEDLESAVRGIRALKIRGSAVSMPHKEAVLKFLDAVDPVAREIGAVNTIVNDAGFLRGFNTDVVAIRDLLADVDPASRTALFGSGGMAKAIAHALKALGFSNVTVVARNEHARTDLAQKSGFHHASEVPPDSQFLLNATPVGMTPDPVDRVPFRIEDFPFAACVLDSVASPSETALIRHARTAKLKILTGFDIVTLQAIEQFRLYTGVTPPTELARRAANFARV